MSTRVGLIVPHEYKLLSIAAILEVFETANKLSGDFSNIPDKDNGQMIRAAASERANKKEAAKNEWNKSEPAPNTKSNTEKLFNEWIKE